MVNRDGTCDVHLSPTCKYFGLGRCNDQSINLVPVLEGLMSLCLPTLRTALSVCLFVCHIYPCKMCENARLDANASCLLDGRRKCNTQPEWRHEGRSQGRPQPVVKTHISNFICQKTPLHCCYFHPSFHPFIFEKPPLHYCSFHDCEASQYSLVQHPTRRSPHHHDFLLLSYFA